jgi:hypothetical protein
LHELIPNASIVEEGLRGHQPPDFVLEIGTRLRAVGDVSFVSCARARPPHAIR